MTSHDITTLVSLTHTKQLLTLTSTNEADILLAKKVYYKTLIL